MVGGPRQLPAPPAHRLLPAQVERLDCVETRLSLVSELRAVWCSVVPCEETRVPCVRWSRTQYYIIVLHYFTVKVHGGRVFIHPDICRGAV